MAVSIRGAVHPRSAAFLEAGGGESLRAVILRTPAWVLAVLAASLVLLLAHAWSLNFLTDDSFISFRYARNLAEGHGLVFNPGHERVEGYTNFLWVVVLAAFERIGIPPHAAATPLTLALTIALWAMVAWFSLREASRRGTMWVAIVPPVFLALTRSVAVWSTSGLETRLLECLVLAGTLRLVVECERTVAGKSAGAPWSAIAFGLAALTRPDGVLISGCALAAGAAWCALRRRLDLRGQALRLSVWAAIVGAHLLFRLAYYGSWVPNTYWAKVSNQSWWAMGATYFGAWFLEYFMWLWIPALILVAIHEWRTGLSVFPVLACAVVVPHALGIAAIGGDHFEYRPIDLYFPFAFLLIGYGLSTLAARPAGRRLAPAYAALIAIGLVWLPLETRRQFPDTYRSRFPGWRVESVGVNRYLEPDSTFFGRVPGARLILTSYARLLRDMTDHMVGTRREELCLFLEQSEPYASKLQEVIARGSLPADTHIAIGAVGLVPYRTGLRTLDRLGLTDATVAHQTSRAGKRIMAHEKSATIEYGSQMGVDLWAAHPSSLLRHVTDRGFLRLLWPAGDEESGIWVAAVGEGYYLVVEFPQGAERGLARFPALDWESVERPEVRRRILDQTVSALRARLDADPSDSQALFRLGNAYLDGQKPKLAAPILERACEARPDEVFPHVRAGMAYGRAGDFGSAIRHQQLALERAREVGAGPQLAILEGDLALLRQEAVKAAGAAEPPVLALSK